jgi:hypothetical protein
MKTQLKDDLNHNDSNPELQGDRESSIKASKIALIVSIPLLGLLLYLGGQALTNPAFMPWLQYREGRSPTIEALNPPQTIAEINAELAKSDLHLGEKLPLNINDGIYPVIDTKSKEIQEIRVYQPITAANSQEKLTLVKKVNITAPDEYFVKAPAYKYKTEKLKPGTANNQMSLTQLLPIEGTSPSRGIWFMATGKSENITYGQVFCYLSQPQPSLNWIVDWTSPASNQPQWEDFTDVNNANLNSGNDPGNSSAAKGVDLDRQERQTAAQISLMPNEPELVLDRSLAFEPSFAVFSLELSRNNVNPIQLREISLNEGLDMPRPYSDSLLLASGGLWSMALQKLEAWKSELQAQGKSWPPFVQEQYQLIAWHAKLLREQADKTIADPGQQALVLALDGRWKQALDVASSSQLTANSVGEMLRLYGLHISQRVKVALKVDPPQEAIIWGALVVLQKDGLAGAQNWLQTQKADLKNAIALLQKFDVSPLGMEPEQTIGNVKILGKEVSGSAWALPPPVLPPGEAWYEVNISVIQDRGSWVNGPFPRLVGRSPVFLWQALGLERNASLSLSLPDTDGQNNTAYLTAHSLSVGSNGELRLLASGSEELSNTLNQSPLPALVTGGSGAFANATGTDTSLSSIDSEIEDRIVRVIYGELEGLGSVSLEKEDFKQQMRSWSFQSVNITGNGQSDLLLELSRRQIDVGDRHYPMVIVFDRNGGLVFSDIATNARRRWIALLPSKKTNQILTEINGQFEAISLR